MVDNERHNVRILARNQIQYMTEDAGLGDVAKHLEKALVFHADREVDTTTLQVITLQHTCP